MDEWLWDHEMPADPLQKDSLNRNKQKFENSVQRILFISRWQNSESLIMHTCSNMTIHIYAYDMLKHPKQIANNIAASFWL